MAATNHAIKTPLERLLAEQLDMMVERVRHLEEQNRRLGLDPLTEIPNRGAGARALEAEFERARRQAGRMAVILVDVDRFKRFNDDHGHFAGDEVLKAVAKALETRVRKADVLCRWGGEEFLVVASAATKNGATLLAEKMRLAVSEVEIDGLPGVTASFGVATLSEDDESAEDVAKRADATLYCAKSRGRNRVEVAP